MIVHGVVWYSHVKVQVFDAISSGALNSSTLAMAKDHSVDGFRFVTIAPGIFRTPVMTLHMTELVTVAYILIKIFFSLVNIFIDYTTPLSSFF